MVEYDRSQSREGTSQTGPRICIVGIGGAGSNVVDRITLDRIVEATLICAHTDVRVLGHSMAPVKIQLGAELMKGIGAGGDPDLGREAAFRRVYQIPGMAKVNQALGRLVRAPGQRARILLHCRRFADVSYAQLLAPDYQFGQNLLDDSDLAAWLNRSF